jgi:hypothetical protein
VHDYYQKSYEAHERIGRRRQEAAAERIIYRARTRRHRRRRTRLAGALGLPSGTRRPAGPAYGGL